MRTWLIAVLVAMVVLLVLVVEAEPQSDDDGPPSRVFNFIRRIFRRRFGDDDGEEDNERGGIFGFILRLLTNLVDDDESDAKTMDTDTRTSERMRMMVRGRKGMRRFLHTFFGTLANYGFGKFTAVGLISQGS